ncbi:metallophosphoesterase 1 homolog [Panonychus citri]|uniref:metallophosphoesterase 1 homolog n=1 Tax=Panonychus citri TaxID=50023 RepID=UPI002307C4D4|nr:metallophosphoesterase 1 homolog [Panonychus citri]XP_053202012.1 metallophosphoesterase 1 homolog [Panonychus citri]
MKLLVKMFSKLANWSFLGAIVLVFNLFLLDIYSIYPCDWPCPDCSDENFVKVMILSDPHLLGKRKGHPVDQFTREWEMSIAFQLAKSIRKPDVIIFLGDLLDEGLTVDENGFDKYVDRFEKIFSIEDPIEKIFIVGNHDIGFHDRVAAYPYLRKRWEKAFNSSLAKLVTIKGIKFISINSMAIEGADFSLVQEMENYLSVVDEQLTKSNLPGDPILLLHFPLYRINDDICHEIDSQKGQDRLNNFTPGVESLSKRTSDNLLERYRPRLIFNGHIHSGCVVNHTKHDSQEWTVASFNWRNRQDPNYLLLQISPNDHSIVKCFLPTEISIVITSILCLITLCVSTKIMGKLVDSHSPKSQPKSKPKDNKKKDKENHKPVSKGEIKKRKSKEKN